jgi:hypothetical protein
LFVRDQDESLSFAGVFASGLGGPSEINRALHCRVTKLHSHSSGHDGLAPKADEKKHVDEAPENPRNEAGQMQLSQRDNG